MQKSHKLSHDLPLQSHNFRLSADHEGKSCHPPNPLEMEADMTRDELNKELRMHSATWQSVVLVYGALVGTLVFSAMAIVS